MCDNLCGHVGMQVAVTRGFGDLPYELRSLSGLLIAKQPQLQFFRGTLALALVDVASRVSPLFTPRTVLIDHHPRYEPWETP